MGIGQFIGEKIGQGAGFALNVATDVANAGGKMAAGVFRLMNGGDPTPADGVIDGISTIASNISGTTGNALAQAGSITGDAIGQSIGNFKPLPTPTLGEGREITT